MKTLKIQKAPLNLKGPKGLQSRPFPIENTEQLIRRVGAKHAGAKNPFRNLAKVSGRL